MPSSIWRQECGEAKVARRPLAALLAATLAPPLLWLTSLEAAYALSYWPCANGPLTALVVVTLAPIPMLLGLAAWVWIEHRHAIQRLHRTPWPGWAARLGIALCFGFVLVALATAVPILWVRPCLA